MTASPPPNMWNPRPYGVLKQCYRDALFRAKTWYWRLGRLESSRVAALYVINLASRTDRWREMERRLAKVSIPVVRIDAVTPETMPPLSRHKRMANRPHMMACFASHRKAWNTVLQEGHDVAWIMEDDAFLKYRYAKHIDTWLSEIEDRDGQWDMIYTGRKNSKDSFKQLEPFLARPVSGDFPFTDHSVVPGPSLFLDGYIVSRSGCRKLLEICGRILYPPDVQVAVFSDQLRVYSFEPRLSVQWRKDSDTWGR